MTLLRFRDPEGDPVVVESSAIVMVRVGRVQGHSGLVTLISAWGTTAAVSEPADEVIAAWTAAREQQAAVAHPGVVGWCQRPDLYQPHVSTLAPPVPAPWAPKRLPKGGDS